MDSRSTTDVPNVMLQLYSILISVTQGLSWWQSAHTPDVRSTTDVQSVSDSDVSVFIPERKNYALIAFKKNSDGCS